MNHNFHMKQVDIILGLKCNEKCSFCFQDTHYIKKYDLSFNHKNVLKVLYLGKKSGLSMVNISGGEPTIYGKEFYYTLKLAQKFAYKDIKVITNGIRFANIEFSKKNLPFITDIGLSFHAPIEYIQDSLTGMKGSYKGVLKAVENIKKYGNVNLHNHCVITSKNLIYLEDHIKKVIQLGFTSIHFMSLMHNTDKNRKQTYDFNTLVTILKGLIDMYKHDIKIEISYIQQCYFKGYEKYVLGFEYGGNYISNNIKSLVSWEKTIINNKYLQDACHDCSYLKKCHGFWK